MKKILVIVVMLALVLSGCSGDGAEAEKSTERQTNNVTTEKTTATAEPAETQTAGEAAPEAEAGLRTIVDNSGRTVENVPSAQDINRVAVISPPLLSMYYAMVGDLDKVVAATPTAIDSGKNGVFFDMAPELKDVDIECLGSREVNAEEFLKLKPDVGLFYADHQGTVFGEVDVPGIQFMIDQIYDPFLTIEAWASLMCEVMGTESEGREIIEYGERVLGDVREKAATIDEGDKLKGMFIHSYANGKISVGGCEFYADFWLTESGLINVAGETARPHQVDMEQIYKWDPDIIFIWNGPSAQDMMDNNVEGHDWSEISAIKNKKVYKIPCGVFAWYPVGSDVPLMMEWVAQQAYPDVFGYDLRADTLDYYQKIYDYELTDEQLTKILDTK
jgi:iron complex transport system substrate-binding protein